MQLGKGSGQALQTCSFGGRAYAAYDLVVMPDERGHYTRRLISFVTQHRIELVLFSYAAWMFQLRAHPPKTQLLDYESVSSVPPAEQMAGATAQLTAALHVLAASELCTRRPGLCLTLAERLP